MHGHILTYVLITPLPNNELPFMSTISIIMKTMIHVIFRTFVAGISPTFFTYSKRTSRYQYGVFLIIAEITDGTGFDSSAAPKWVSVNLHDRWQLQHITRISYCCFPTLLDQRDKSEQAENNKRSLYNAT